MPLGLAISAVLVLSGVSVILKSVSSDPETTSQPGWRIIRPPYDVSALAEQDQTIWAGGKDGLFRLDLSSGELIEEDAHFPSLEHVRALLVDEGGVLWVGHQSGLSRYQNDNWYTFTEADGLPDNRVNALMLDHSGILWVGTWGGVATYEDDTWQVLTKDDGLLENMVNVMLEDQQGGIWFGSYIAPRGGISYLRDGKWQYFNTDNGLPHNNITSLIETSSGIIWAGTGLFDRGGACEFRLTNSGWEIAQVLGIKDGLAGEKVRSISQDREGVIWFGSEYDGLALLDDENWFKLNVEDGISHPEIKVIYQEKGFPHKSAFPID